MKMVYKRGRKTARGTLPQEKYVEACKTVIEQGKSIRSVATTFGMCHVTLSRYIAKYKTKNTLTTGYNPHNKVFSTVQEKELADYCKTACQLYFGLTTKDFRKLAYNFAKGNDLKYPATWDGTELASVDWYKAFMKRHPNLSVRRPEATSLARAMNFNKPNVEKFFDKWAELLDRLQYQPQNIYNIDETGVTTTQKPGRVIAEKGTKQVGSITSQERGTLVTVCLAVNAIGNAVPPFFVFPRKNFQPHFIRDGPPGCDGSGNKSGWMQDEDFLLFMKHFAKFAKPTQENPVVVIMDNHSSHISVPVIQFCKVNFISVLSFPPHTSHKLQPLDRAVFGPFKTRFNNAADQWIRNHPGQRMTIYDLPALVKTAMSLAATPSNITAGFACTGIWPYNKDIFPETDFAPASVTDQPSEEVNTEQYDRQDSQPEDVDLATNSQVRTTSVSSPLPSTSGQALLKTPVHVTPPNTSNHSSLHNMLHCTITPRTFYPTIALEVTKRKSLVDLMPLPKAPLRVKSKTGRSKGKSAIYTDTPEKEALEANKRKITLKNMPKMRNLDSKPKMKKTKKKLTVKMRVNDDEDMEEENYCIVCFGSYNTSKEDWLQCTDCHKWAHSSCAKNDPFFVCLNCLSE